MLGLFTGLALDRACLRRALEQRIRLIQQLEEFLGAWDCWICPAFPTPAFTHRPAKASIEVDRQSLSQLEANLHSIIFNTTGHPVVTMPIGLSPERLPIGVQVIGSRWQEMALLNTVRQIASVTRGFQRPPGY
jgi:amidase